MVLLFSISIEVDIDVINNAGIASTVYVIQQCAVKENICQRKSQEFQKTGISHKRVLEEMV